MDGNEEMRRQTEQEYMRAMLGACNLDEWREIVEKAVADAKAGDAKAREWLAAYVVGRPTREAPSALALLVDELVGEALAFGAKASFLCARAEGPLERETGTGARAVAV